MRWVLHPDAAATAGAIQRWARRISPSLASDSDHYVMIHCPDNQYCPAFASQFHEPLARLAGVGDSIVWPATTARGPEQDIYFNARSLVSRDVCINVRGFYVSH